MNNIYSTIYYQLSLKVQNDKCTEYHNSFEQILVTPGLKVIIQLII